MAYEPLYETFERYLSRRDNSISRIMAFDRSPLAYWWERNNAAKRTHTRASLKGTATHCAVFEPDQFGKRYTKAEQCDGEKKNGERCSNPGTRHSPEHGWRCGIHAKSLAESDFSTVEILPDGLYHDCIGMKDAVLTRNKAARAIIEASDAECEATFLWRDTLTDLECKMKPDLVSRLAGMTLDLKTTASFFEFEQIFRKLRFHIRASFYLGGFEEVGYPVDQYAFLMVDSSEPYDSTVLVTDPITLAVGQAEHRPVMERLANYMETIPQGERDEQKHWEGRGNTDFVKLPSYYERRVIQMAADGEIRYTDPNYHGIRSIFELVAENAPQGPN